MDKAAIKTFAINSRRKLMEDVEYRMSLVGVTRDGIQDSITDAEGKPAKGKVNGTLIEDGKVSITTPIPI